MKKSLIVTLCLLIFGCSTTEVTKIRYENPTISPDDRENQWLIDHGQCVLASNSVKENSSHNCTSNSAYSESFCNTMQNAQQIEYLKNRKAVYEGCLAEKGYSKIEY